MDLSNWRDHQECRWTWPNPGGVTGCEDHHVVFETPSGDEAWEISPSSRWGRK